MHRLGRCTDAHTAPPAAPSNGCSPALQSCDCDRETKANSSRRSSLMIALFFLDRLRTSKVTPPHLLSAECGGLVVESMNLFLSTDRRFIFRNCEGLWAFHRA